MLGRDRSVETSRWMSRIIDLDLICVEQKTVESEDLKLPHPEMHRRDFVLKPMSEVCPDWIHPVLKRSVAELLSELHKG
jgi:2-amino-4-hydroxy-6-hydroxymethyldihydropteridine diphosphokinase